MNGNRSRVYVSSAGGMHSPVASNPPVAHTVTLRSLHAVVKLQIRLAVC